MVRSGMALLAGLFILGVLPGDLVWAKTWTDREGNEIEAELVGYSPADEVVTVLKQGKEFRLPLARLSDGDRDFVLSFHANKVKANAARAGELRGLFDSVPVEKRAFPTPEGYLGTKDAQRYVQSFLWRGETPLQALGYDPAKERLAIWAPENYDGVTPFGVYVCISPSPQAWHPRGEYEALFEKHRLIVVSAYDAGNGHHLFRRVGLALDGLATVHAKYETDPARYYVGGVSGGGICSTHSAFLYPDHFQASFNIVRGALIDSYVMPREIPGHYEKGKKYGNTWPFMKEEDWERMAKERPDSRWVFISGEKDYNYDFARESEGQWMQRGFVARFFDVPGMAHTNAPAEWFEKALLWVEESREARTVMLD
ncbi:MAG: hypothetical protein AAF591_05350 [Verrucomicrobiota bacterium]